MVDQKNKKKAIEKNKDLSTVKRIKKGKPKIFWEIPRSKICGGTI